MIRTAPFFALAGAVAGWLLRPHSELPAVAAGGILAAVALAVPYGRRFRATAGEHVSLVAHLALLLLLPLLPLAFARAPIAWTWAYQALFAWIVGAMLQSQGRYFGTEREVPELAGPAREIADRALADAGLRPVQVLVTRFPNLNAFVVGLKTCVVVVDRRTSESLSPGQFRAMLAHEAAHVMQNATFWHALPYALAATLLNVALGWSLETPMLALAVAGALFCAGGTLKQALELGADRFAARLAPVADVAAMLRRVTADLAPAVRFAAHSWLAVPFASHPPLEARLGAIGAGPAGPLWLNRALRYGVLIASALPWAATFLRWPHARELALATMAALVVLVGVSYYRRWTTATDSYAIMMGMGGGSARWRLAGAVVLLCAVAAGVASRVGLPERLVWLPLAPAGSVILALAALWMFARSARGPIASLTKGERRATAEAVAALSEGKPAEALELATRGLQSYPKQPWLQAVRGACLAQTGDPESAVAELRTLDRDFSFGLYQLVDAELLAGLLDEARADAVALTELAPRDPLAWESRGLVEFARGDAVAAEAAFAETCRLRPADARGLAWRGIAAAERAGGWTPEAARLLAGAREIEPDSPSVHLAEARAAGLAGDARAARAAYDAAMEALRREGLAGWGRWFATLARRWGIVSPPA